MTGNDDAIYYAASRNWSGSVKALVLRRNCEIMVEGRGRTSPDLPLGKEPLETVDLPVPEPGEGEILIEVRACGICHTDLDEIEGRLHPPLPVIPGHQIVGRVAGRGAAATGFEIGERVGVAWIHHACGSCRHCLRGEENLCPYFKGTGCDADGGYAEYTLVHEDFAYPIPETFSDSHAAPLLCAGAIGYRAIRLTGLEDGDTLGLFGFGASAHVAIQVVKHLYPGSKVYVFTRKGQEGHQDLARRLGADWIGATGDTPPSALNCAIDFTPAWTPIVEGMRLLDGGGRLVINAIRKEGGDRGSLLGIDYPTHLWQEKELKSVANITRRDALEFLPLAARIPVRPEVQEFPLEDANSALRLLKAGRVRGAGVLKIGG